MFHRTRGQIVNEHGFAVFDFSFLFVSAKVRKSLVAMLETSVARIKVIKESIALEIVR